jgi:hypothetical protein
MQRGVPVPPPGTEQALARSTSQLMPQPLQFVNEGWLRPSLPGATPVRDTQVVPQQRSVEPHSGRQRPGPPSVPGGTPPSVGPPTHAAALQTPEGQTTPQPPQLFGSFTICRHIGPATVSQHIEKSAQAGEHDAPPLFAQPATSHAHVTRTPAPKLARVIQAMFISYVSIVAAPAGRDGGVAGSVRRGADRREEESSRFLE